MTESHREELAPVLYLEGERTEPPPSTGVGLCLSGGGYRAMLFHVGVLWRLNEARWLERLDRVSSVSGGSITAGVLAVNWDKLDFQGGVAQAFVDRVVAPVRRLARRTVDVRAGLLSLGPGGANYWLAASYRRHVFGKRTLASLPDTPVFVFNTTNLQSGALCQFTKEAIVDDRVGSVCQPQIPLARAVAASSAFPPFLSPARLRVPASAYEPVTDPVRTDLHRAPYTTTPILSDGGVYDNLGLEPCWKSCRTVLISDAGGHMGAPTRVTSFWPLQLYRVLKVIDNQVRDLRKRQAVSGYEAGMRDGAYWGIRSDISKYPAQDLLPFPHDRSLRLAGISTRLARMKAGSQERLINWGYAITDAAIRSHVDPEIPPPADYPYPEAGVD